MSCSESSLRFGCAVKYLKFVGIGVISTKIPEFGIHYQKHVATLKGMLVVVK